MTAKPIKLIAFDLDGTMLNTVPDLTLALNLALRDLNLANASEAQVITWVGNGMDVLLQRAITELGLNLEGQALVEFKQKFHHYYDLNSCNRSVLYPNVLTTLQTLYQAGYILAVVTNKSSKYVRPILQHFNIEQYFSAVFGAQDVPVLKPHPAALFALCGKFGLYPNEIIFIGDSNNDVLIAKNAGCHVLGLTYGYNYGQPIDMHNPDWVSDDIQTILKILAEYQQ